MEKKGFTLIELLVVMSIISLLSSIAFASFANAKNKGKDAAAKEQVKSIQSQALIWYSDNKKYDFMWGGGTAVDKMWVSLINILDNNGAGGGARGSNASGDYYYGEMLLKDGKMMCFDATNVIEELPYVTPWNYPAGPNYLCP